MLMNKTKTKTSDVTRSVNVERSLDRVRAEVFRMETSADIAKVVRVLWDELLELDYDILRASITIIDEDKDFWGSYQVGSDEGQWSDRGRAFRRLGDKLYMSVIEIAISSGGGPYREPLLEAWRRKEVFRYTLRTPADRKKMAAFVRRFSDEVEENEVPDFQCVYVPFLFGFVGLFSSDLNSDQFGDENIALLARFGDAFAMSALVSIRKTSART